MKRALLLILIFLILVLSSFVSLGISQTATNSGPTLENTTEVMGEDDRLPFMQTEESPETREPTSSGLLFKTLGAMLLIVGLIFFGAWALKKMGFGGIKASEDNDRPSLSVLSSVPMGSGRTLSTIRFGERVLLVGVTPQAITLLAEETPLEEFSLQNPRSVAELLAEDNHSFDEEFQKAQSMLGLWHGKGEKS